MLHRQRRPLPAAALLGGIALAFLLSLAGPVAPLAAEESAAEPRITLYATSWCGYCAKTRQLLKNLDAAYVEKDIEKSQEAYREMLKKSGGSRGVPVLDIDGKIVRGFDERRIRQLVAEMKQEKASQETAAASR